MEAIINGKRKEASTLCENYLHEGNSHINLYESIIKPALYEVGILWEKNQISVATEHMSTAITEGILNALYPNIIPERYGEKKIVLTCVQNEEHQVGIKMVADIFELNKWESFFLGSGFPTTELISFIDEIKPDVLAISLCIFFNFSKLTHMIQEINSAFPDLEIIIGGQAFLHISPDKFPDWKNVTYIPDLSQLENYIQTIK